MVDIIVIVIVFENIVEVFEYFFLKIDLFIEIFVGLKKKEVKNLDKWDIKNIKNLFLIFSKVFNFD